MPVSARKSPTRAFLLALMLPGSGHAYSGRYRLALGFFVFTNPAALLFSFHRLADLFGDGPHNALVLAFLICAWLSQAIDAALLTRAFNRRSTADARRRERRASASSDSPPRSQR